MGAGRWRATSGRWRTPGRPRPSVPAPGSSGPRSRTSSGPVTGTPDISIVIVNWNGGEALLQCLARSSSTLRRGRGRSSSSTTRPPTAASPPSPDARACGSSPTPRTAAWRRPTTRAFWRPDGALLISNPDVVYRAGAVDALLDRSTGTPGPASPSPGSARRRHAPDQRRRPADAGGAARPAGSAAAACPTPPRRFLVGRLGPRRGAQIGHGLRPATGPPYGHRRDRPRRTRASRSTGRGSTGRPGRGRRLGDLVLAPRPRSSTSAASASARPRPAG